MESTPVVKKKVTYDDVRGIDLIATPTFEMIQDMQERCLCEGFLKQTGVELTEEVAKLVTIGVHHTEMDGNSKMSIRFKGQLIAQMEVGMIDNQFKAVYKSVAV